MSFRDPTPTSEWQERTAMEFRARTKQFVGWLATQGATILPTCSSYEVLRYTAWDDSQRPTSKRPQTHVIYRKADGRVSFTGESYKHFNRFLAHGALDDQSRVAKPKTKAEAERQSWTKRTRDLLYERDGHNCCICGDPLDYMCGDKQRGPVTIEHWLARHLGGTDHIDNLKLAHARCNRDVGHRTPEEKAEIAAMYARGLVSDVAHWGVNPRPRTRPVQPVAT